MFVNAEHSWNKGHSSEQRIPKTNKILVWGDILWFEREISEFLELLSQLFCCRFFLKNVKFLRLKPNWTKITGCTSTSHVLCLLPDVFCPTSGGILFEIKMCLKMGKNMQNSLQNRWFHLKTPWWGKSFTWDGLISLDRQRKQVLAP